MKEEAIIVDIDGTLSDPSDRRELVESDLNDWESFFERVDEDYVNNFVAEIVYRFDSTHEVILVTGRPERSKEGVKVREKTVEWLEENGIPFDELIMRDEGDFREDVEVKQEILDEKLPDPESILFALDDRSDIAEMWRSNGIPCLQTEDEVTD